MLCFAQMVAPNWVKSLIEFGFKFSMAYFRSLDEYKDKDTRSSKNFGPSPITFPKNYHLFIDDGFIHGGNMTVSYSHPSSLWHIPTKWEYDWWEYAGRPSSSSSSSSSSLSSSSTRWRCLRKARQKQSSLVASWVEVSWWSPCPSSSTGATWWSWLLWRSWWIPCHDIGFDQNPHFDHCCHLQWVI